MSRATPAPPLGALCRRLARGIAQEARRELIRQGHTDVRPAHNLVFALVASGVTRTTDMAARLGMSKQAVTLMVSQLEAGGYVSRVPDGSDGRAKLVQLTDRGRAAAAVSARVAAAAERRWAEVIGPERLVECKTALQELIEQAPIRPIP